MVTGELHDLAALLPGKGPSCPLMRLVGPQCCLLKSSNALFSLPHPYLMGEIMFGGINSVRLSSAVL